MRTRPGSRPRRWLRFGNATRRSSEGGRRTATRCGGRLFIAKDSGWMKLLPKEIIRGVPAYRIRREFDELFRRRRTIGWQRAGQRRWAIGRSDRARSLAVAEFCAYASQNWELLSQPFQNDLKRALGYAEDEKGNHYLGVMGAGPEHKGSEDEEEDL